MMERHGSVAGSSATSYLAALARMFERVEVTAADGAPLALDEGIARATDLVLSLKTGGKALLIGNGGSAAVVSHMQCDLCKAVGVRAIVFNEAPLLMALANDDGYPSVFHRPVGLWADRQDVLIAVSSSDESENIVLAARLASENGCRLITFSGFKPGIRLRQLGHVNIYVPDSTYGCVEVTHSAVGHCITDLAVAKTAGRR